ncbi:phospholipid phosphatase 1-like isoform X2 [Coccinella septempunctata]|uniref:phospholipid phosphatase 1-like isoform X2 n=1 Tax=Coccinella septempunctata TaxID=41139 RepID=UPI001D079B98|nr:phospholipid phosphatase 1-like isoform X2 [Coccinella septempunctata]
MHNLYPNVGEHYVLRNENTLCYENKAMANAMIADQLPTPHHTIVSTGDCEKPKQNPATVSCRKFWPRSLRFTVYVDVLTTIVFFVIFVSIELGVIPQRKLGFRCKDPSISYPYTGDTITLTILLLGTYFGPLLLIIFIEIVREKSLKDIRIGVVWDHYKELLIGVSFVIMITEVAKAMLGEHRPHFFDVCRPDANEGCTEGAFIEDYTCTNKEYSSWLISDASKSFPSGHSSISVFASLFTAYVIQTRLPSAATGRLFKPFLIAVCLSWGILCSLSRIADRRHHWWDVLSGTVLGILGVIFFTTIFHQKQKNKLHRASEKSISSTMLLDVKNKTAASARV